MHSLIEKRTGDSFGAVQFTEMRDELVEVAKTIEAKSVDGKIKFDLPGNTIKWSGQLFNIDAAAPVAFNQLGIFEGFSVKQAVGEGSLTIFKAN